MTTFEGFPIDRRALLGLAGVAALAPATASPDLGNPIADQARPRHGEALSLFAKAHARLDGKPTFWISRGREYGFIDGRYEQIYERHVVSAKRAVASAEDGLKASYCEAAYSTAPGETEPRSELPSPFTGRSYPNPLIRPLKMTWDVSAEAVISARVQTANVHANYNGRIDTQLGPDGRALVDCLVRIDTQRGTVRRFLTEVGPYAADWQAERRGYVPASRAITVYRLLPEDISGGPAGVMLGVHASRKHESIDGLRAALTASELRLFHEWFDAWESMLLSSEDFLMQGA